MYLVDTGKWDNSTRHQDNCRICIVYNSLCKPKQFWNEVLLIYVAVYADVERIDLALGARCLRILLCILASTLDNDIQLFMDAVWCARWP